MIFRPDVEPLIIDIDDALRHVACLGATGVGKSFALITWIEQALRSPYGVCFIDFHSDLYTHILDRQTLRLAFHAQAAAQSKDPQQQQRHWQQIEEFISRTIIIDPTDPNSSHIIPLDPLQLGPGEIPERKARSLASMVTKLWADDPLIVVRMRRVLFHALWALLELPKATLVDLPRWLTDVEFRRKRLPELRDPVLRQYWEYEYPASHRQQIEWAGSTLNRMGEFLADPIIRLMTASGENVIRRAFLDQGGRLFVNLDKQKLGGEDNARLLAGFIVDQVKQVAASRTDVPRERRRPTIIFLDECQNMGTNLNEYLAEVRKFGISLFLATQYFSELNEAVQQAILNTVGSLVVFQTGFADAEILAPNLFPVDLLEAKKIPWSLKIAAMLAKSGPVEPPELVELTQEATYVLQTLPSRYFFYKRRGPGKVILARTIEEPRPILTADEERLKEFLIAEIGARWGRSVVEIRAEIEMRWRTETDKIKASDGKQDEWLET